MSSQYIVYSTSGIQSSTDTLSISVEICVFRFCFVEPKMGNPLTIDRPAPVRPLILGCTVNDPTIHRFSMPRSLSLRVSGILLVPLIYFIRWINLARSSFSGSLTLVERNKTAAHVSSLELLMEKNIFSTRLWNSTTCLVFSFYSLSRT